jgi:pheromone shutdown protein TraB
MGMTIFSWIGWAIGNKIGEVMTAFTLSSIGSIVGVYLGWLVNKRWL